MNNSAKKETPQYPAAPHQPASGSKNYRIRFRQGGQPYSAVTKIENLADGELVMVKSDHGLEPAMITGFGASFSLADGKKAATHSIVRRANREENEKYINWIKREEDAFKICRSKIDELRLPMKLVRVERFFNGSNIVFYFTADNRVDFRGLVKILVQEFRTRVEMRQVGVRHETKMIGGIGYCGRELCCSSFMKKFMPVSIKMVKEQDLPLNPTKISGVCNRLLCCLTHEFSTYKACKKGMPKQGKIVELDGRQYKVAYRNILQETVKLAALGAPDDIVVLGRAEWNRLKVVAPGDRVKKSPDSARGATRAKRGGPAGGRKREAGGAKSHKRTYQADSLASPDRRTAGETGKGKPGASAKSSRRPKTKRSRRSKKVNK